MSLKPALLNALNTLKTVAEGDCQALQSAFDACRHAPNDIHYAHVLYAEISELAIQHKLWDIAEEFAVKTLKQLPSSGKALKLLGKALKGQNRLNDAAVCHRYGLPESIREKHFSHTTLQRLNSQQSKNVEFLEAYAAQNSPLSEPIAITETAESALSQEHLYSAPAFTFRLNNARLWFDGFNTVVWDSENNVIEDASRGMPEVVHSALGERQARKLNGMTCVLGNRNSGNYYHWMNDVIPRIHVLQKCGIDIHSIDNFIVNSLNADFQKETLGHLGINNSQLCIADHEHYFQCDELLVPLYGSNTLGKGQACWNPAFLKSTFLTRKKSELDNVPIATQRLYVSRKHARGRSITNEDELVVYLEKKGFRRVFLEGLSVGDQALLFNSAEVVIGAHGAGLSNIAFCEKDTTVIELYKDHIAPCFWISSEMTGLRHAVHYCGSDESMRLITEDESFHNSADERRLSDFYVCISRLEILLNKLQIN